ncbi:prophage antirepressor-like protein [Massilia sp. MP_M2]|uniref:BRO-N domain-containing protein n=1 Tax=Massilia sp. MP_M2 TaxID=3071713 RepID=UPI00319E5048
MPINKKTPIKLGGRDRGFDEIQERKFEMNATAVTKKMQRALSFGAHEVKTITREGQLWMSGTEVGLALEYASPEKAVKQLYSGHADEFTSTMTRVVRVMTAGGKQAIRFFSLRGAHLLSMFARTDKAKAFRKWVLNILDAEVEKPAKKQIKSYHYPIDSAKPVAMGVASILTPKMMLDAKNPAPELRLLDQLSADGHDVSGPRIRILAMLSGLEYSENLRERVARWERAMASLGEDMSSLSRERGKPVIFGRAPNPADAIHRHVYRDQMPVLGGAA